MAILLFGSWALLISLLTIFFIRVSSPSTMADNGNETYLTYYYRANFPTAWATGISPVCYNDSQSFLKAFLNREKWALQSIMFIWNTIFICLIYISIYSVQSNWRIFSRRIEQFWGLFYLTWPVWRMPFDQDTFLSGAILLCILSNRKSITQ